MRLIHIFGAICVAFLNQILAYDEIELNDAQSQKLGIGSNLADFSGYSLIGPFVANLDFSNTSAVKQSSPFEITISKINKQEGQQVKKGEIICEIMGDSLSNLIYEYNNTKSKLQIAHSNEQKDKKLYDGGLLSMREYQQSYLLANELNFRLKDLDNTIKQIGINPQTSGFSYSVVAKIDGILALAPKQVGQKIDAFLPYVVIAQDNKKLANIKIPHINALDIKQNASVFIGSENKIEVGTITAISVAIDKMTNTINASANLDSPNLIAGSNVDVFIMIENPSDSIVVLRENVTKFGNDYIVFVKTKNGYMPTKIEILKEINNGFIIKKGNISKDDLLANGAIITLKGAMSNLGFE